MFKTNELTIYFSFLQPSIQITISARVVAYST